MTAPVIMYEGLTLKPVTAAEAKTRPWYKGSSADSLYETIHSTNIYGAKTRQTIAQLMKPGDQLYYWDGPWAVLAGSSGLALVRRGQVVDTFTLIVS